MPDLRTALQNHRTWYVSCGPLSYGKVLDHSEVSPASKPSAKKTAQSRKTGIPASPSARYTYPPATSSPYANPGVSKRPTYKGAVGVDTSATPKPPLRFAPEDPGGPRRPTPPARPGSRCRQQPAPCRCRSTRDPRPQPPRAPARTATDRQALGSLVQTQAGRSWRSRKDSTQQPEGPESTSFFTDRAHSNLRPSSQVVMACSSQTPTAAASLRRLTVASQPPLGSDLDLPERYPGQSSFALHHSPRP